MSAFQPVIKQGAQGQYYEVGGIKYTGTFPYEWATNHKFLDGTEFCSGPKDCSNCREFGSINGVFVGYCSNCVTYIYNGETYPKRNDCIYNAKVATDDALWAACPYLQGISLSRIGDKVAEKVENQELTERQLERARYWARRERYWDAYYDENGRSIFDEGFREPVEEPPYPCSQIGDKKEAIVADYTINDDEDFDNYNSRREQDEYDEEEEDYYEAYRDNDDYYDQWDEPYSDEYPITRRELAQVPADMRAAFDPEYQIGLANFRAAAMEK